MDGAGPGREGLKLEGGGTRIGSWLLLLTAEVHEKLHRGMYGLGGERMDSWLLLRFMKSSIEECMECSGALV